MGVLASQGLGLDGEHLPPLKKPRYDRQDSEQLFLERLPSSVRGVAPLDFAPHSLDGLATSPRLADARGLEGQPLRRFGAEAVRGRRPRSRRRRSRRGASRGGRSGGSRRATSR